MPGRSYSPTSQYRYGFNGKENDKDISEGGQDYGMRISDTRLGKFLSVDPITKKYPELTPYQFASNRPIDGIDLDGLEWSKSSFLHPLGFEMMFDGARSGTVARDAGGSFAKGYILGYLKSGAKYPLGMAGAALLTVTAVTALPYVATLSVNGLTWASFPANQLLASTGAGFAFAVLSPDPSYIPNFPGPGDEIGKTINLALKTKAGKVVQFFAEKGAKFANQSEWRWAQILLDEGKNVRMLKESTEQGVKSADLFVNNVRTELKEISNMLVSNKLGDRMLETMQGAVKQAGSGGNIIIDVTKQTGATKELLETTIKRLNGSAKEAVNYRVVGNGYEITGALTPKKG